MNVVPILKEMYLYAEGAVLVRTQSNRVALASVPRSGNTWLRNLIEAATGEPSTSIYYGDVSSFRQRRLSSGIVIKTHLRDASHYHRAIHLVRNPFDVIDSFYHFRRQIGGATHLTWEEHVPCIARLWRKHTEHWCAAKCDIHRMTYESLKENPAQQMRLLVDWLGRAISDEQIAAAVQACQIEKLRAKHAKRKGDVATKFFRRGEVGRGIEAFTDEQIQWVLNEAGPTMTRFGYTADRPTMPQPVEDTPDTGG